MNRMALTKKQMFTLPIWFTFYNRVKNMTSEEISEKFGFKGNKFLDCTNE